MRFGRVGEKSRLVLKLSTASIEAYEGSVRSSKTITSILDFAKFLRSGRPGEFAIVGRTERTAYRNIIEPMIAMFGKRHIRYNRGLGTVSIFGRTGYLLGANNEASRTKIQGLTLLALYLDEAATLPESFFNMAYSRLSLDGAKMWLTANPEGRNHWLLVNWLQKARLWVQGDGTVVETPDSPVDLHRYTFVLDDNPYLSASFVQRLKASYSGVWYLRFVLSQWTNAEGAIFDAFDPAVHVIEALPPGVSIARKIVGIDYGTTNATAAVLIGEGSDGVAYVLDEWRHDVRAGEAAWVNAQLSRGIRDWLEPHAVQWVMVDPSAASFRLQLTRDGVRRVAPADNTVTDGIRDVASLLTTGRLVIIGPKCPFLLGEMPEYAWDPKATTQGRDEPIKKNDHSVDALRYAVRTALVHWRTIRREAA